MLRGDIGRAIDWAALEGWNPGHADADCFASVDAYGFIGGWLNDRLIASISVVNYGTDFSFLGFYIVDPAFRGHGYGYRLWRDAIGHAGDRLIGLDGVTAEQENYRRSGFEFAYRNVRYGGVLAEFPGLDTRPEVKIAPIDGVTPALSAFDRRMFPAPRDRFLDAWVSAPGHVSRAAYRGDDVAGYGVLRPCRHGHKIGPLFAEDRLVAQELLADLLSAREGSGEVFLDVPEPNKNAVALAQDLGLDPVFETARMYTGPAPAIALENIYGVTTFELG